jgi:hypothetical protein
MNFRCRSKVSSSKRAVLCCLKTNATNGNYRVVVSNLVKPRRPVLFVSSPKNWVQWWRSPMLYEVLPKREAERWPVMPVVGFLHHASPDTYPYGWRAFRQGLTQTP